MYSKYWPQLAMVVWYAAALSHQQCTDGGFGSQWLYYYPGFLQLLLRLFGFLVYELHVYGGMVFQHNYLDYNILRGADLQGVHEFSRLQGSSLWEGSVRFIILSLWFQDSIRACDFGKKDRENESRRWPETGKAAKKTKWKKRPVVLDFRTCEVHLVCFEQISSMSMVHQGP